MSDCVKLEALNVAELRFDIGWCFEKIAELKEEIAQLEKDIAESVAEIARRGE